MKVLNALLALSRKARLALTALAAVAAFVLPQTTNPTVAGVCTAVLVAAAAVGIKPLHQP